MIQAYFIHISRFFIYSHLFLYEGTLPPVKNPAAAKSKKTAGRQTGEKKPPNAYIVFCQLKRAQIQKQYLQVGNIQ